MKTNNRIMITVIALGFFFIIICVIWSNSKKKESEINEDKTNLEEIKQVSEINNYHEEEDFYDINSLEKEDRNDGGALGDNIPEEIDVLTEDSPVWIKTMLEDGSFWAYDKKNKEQVHADVNNIVYARVPDDGNNVKGISEDLYVIGSFNCKVWNVSTGEEITDMYLGDYDEIANLIKTENGYVFVVAKYIEDYMEEYVQYKLVDMFGNELNRISLDSENLMNKYGIKKDYSVRNPSIQYAGNGVYYIDKLGEGENNVNSILIDTNRNKVYPIYLETNISSDGDYTLMDEGSGPIRNGSIVFDHEYGVEYKVEDNDHEYRSFGEI